MLLIGQFIVIIHLYIKKRFIKYCIYATSVSIIEILVFTLLNDTFNISILLSNIISFMVYIFLSYYANSKYVYKKIFVSKKELFNNFIIYFISRLFGLLIDTIILYILIDKLLLSSFISKMISSLSTTLINYVIGKYIFK